ncbi:tellurite resistance TerB family protein, partial [Cereibacter sphaeroides]
MSFVRTMATLAVGFAAARGLETFQKMGGGAGIA